MNIKEKLEKIDHFRSEINDYFDNMVTEMLVDMTSNYWTVFGEYKSNHNQLLPESATKATDVGWSEESPMDSDDREHVYREEVTFIVRKEHYTLVCIRTSTGHGGEDFVFSNSKEISEKELDGS